MSNPALPSRLPAILQWSEFADSDDASAGLQLPAAEQAALMDQIYARGDRLVTKFIALHTLIAFLLGGIYQTWLTTLVITGCAVGIYAVSAWLLPRSFITRCLAGVSLQAFVCLHIYQLHGMPEMHFFFFTAFTMLIVYQDWKSMWPGALALILQHLVFAILHNSGAQAGLFFYEEGYVGIFKLFCHFTIALGEVAICGYWAYLLRRQTLATAVQTANLRQAESEAGRRASQQAATGELARQGLAGLSASELFHQAVSLVTRGLEVEFAYVGELLEGGKSMRLRAQVGYPAEVSGMEYPIDSHSQGGFTLATRKPVIVEDFETETRFATTPLARSAGVRSGLSVVIGDQDESFGVLVAQSAEPGKFTSDDDAFLSAVAHILSSALARQRTEEDLYSAKAEAERANNAKSDFLSRMSHELRTPLNAILGFGQLLEISDLPPKAIESTGHIMKAGNHLLGLIDEVLAIARIEAGRVNLSLEAVRLAEVVGECVSLVSRQAEARGLRCENRCAAPEAARVFVHADHQRLRQVLLNLLSNAVKYNREEGLITIGYQLLPKAPAGADASLGWLRIEVTDTGRGLAEADLGRLFTPFERLSAERTDVEGTGLGLALSKALVEAMGGAIGVESTLGEGSTFWLQFPVDKDPEAQLADIIPALGIACPEGQKRGSVLYIEDNLSNLRLIEILIEERPNYDLLSAQQGNLGLEIARARNPDLILLDLHLPDIPGWEVLTRIQADPDLCHIPVVVISADATPRQIDRMTKMGVREYITKPINVNKLIRVLDEHLCNPGAATEKAVPALAVA